MLFAISVVGGTNTRQFRAMQYEIRPFRSSGSKEKQEFRGNTRLKMYIRNLYTDRIASFRLSSTGGKPQCRSVIFLCENNVDTEISRRVCIFGPYTSIKCYLESCGQVGENRLTLFGGKVERNVVGDLSSFFPSYVDAVTFDNL